MFWAMKLSRLKIITIIILVCVHTALGTLGWFVEDFPPPADGGFVVDPDNILNDRSADAVADKIEAVERRVLDVTKIPLQMAVAIVGKVCPDYCLPFFVQFLLIFEAAANTGCKRLVCSDDLFFILDPDES